MVQFGLAIVAAAEDMKQYIPVDKYMDFKMLKKHIKGGAGFPKEETAPGKGDGFFGVVEAELRKVRDNINNMAYSYGKRVAPASAEEKAAQLEFVRLNREGFRKILKKWDKKNEADPAKKGQRTAPLTARVNQLLREPTSQLEQLLLSSLPPQDTVADKRVVVGAFALVVLVTLTVALTCRRALAAFVLGLFAAGLLGFANGANDIANSMGTSVGAGVLTARQAVGWGALFEFLGAMTMGQFVAKEISKGIISVAAYAGAGEVDLFSFSMLCVLCAAGPTTLLAAARGTPISATHSVVGALVAVGAAGRGASSVQWGKLGEVCVGWVASPLLGCATSLLVYLLIRKSVLLARDPGARAVALQPAFVALTVAVLLLFFLFRGSYLRTVWEWAGWWFAVLVALALGCIVAQLVAAAKGGGCMWLADEEASEEGERQRQQRKAAAAATTTAAAAATATEAAAAAQPLPAARLNQALKETTVKVLGGDRPGALLREALEQRPSSPAAASAAIVAIADGGHGEEEDGDEEHESPESLVLDDVGGSASKLEAENAFRPLLLLSALGVAFAHGANDVGNAVGPLCVIWQVYDTGALPANGEPDIPWWALLLGASGMVGGILALGSRTIETVGTKITTLTPTRSFATQIGAAVAVLASSAAGLPVSTSHCLVGSITGVGLAQKLSGVTAPLSLSVLKGIVLSWVATIPFAMLLAIIVYYPFASLYK